MSGLEVAGVLLGAFPLIISSLEHWRDVAKVGGFFWKIRKSYGQCRTDVQFHEIVYKRNLKELLLPIVSDADKAARLLGDPGGKAWSDEALGRALEARLAESYSIYMTIIADMNETAEELRRELCFEKTSVQDKLAPPEAKKQRQPSPNRPPKTVFSKSTFDYQVFRVKFSLGEPVRDELFGRLKECNERLEKLLSTSDKVSALQSASLSTTKQMSALEAAFKNAWKKSDQLFKALQTAWNCSCQQYHFANLRLEHRTLPDICFEVILMFVVPSGEQGTPWSWRELQCGHMRGCPALKLPSPSPNGSQNTPVMLSGQGCPPLHPKRAKKVAFAPPTVLVPQIKLDDMAHSTLKLCQLLGGPECGDCMGVIGHDDETYHLHPCRKWKKPNDESTITLDHILSSDFDSFLTRRQRYAIALLLASSVAQLQFTPWLRTGLAKTDVLFFPSDDSNMLGEPFIRQGFSVDSAPDSATEAQSCNFYSLGILLLELCFGKRLEDHSLRRKHPIGDVDSKQAFDLMAALQWSRNVTDEGGEDYAAAVKWCFTGAGTSSKNWRSEIIKHVIRPLEMCQEHFKMAATI